MCSPLPTYRAEVDSQVWGFQRPQRAELNGYLGCLWQRNFSVCAESPLSHEEGTRWMRPMETLSHLMRKISAEEGVKRRQDKEIGKSRKDRVKPENVIVFCHSPQSL